MTQAKTKFGRNMKITLGRSHRDAFTSMMTELGSKWVDADTVEMRIFTMPDGFSLGAQLLDDADALDMEATFIGPWLEFLVDDVERMTASLRGVGCTTFEYTDRTHPYFRAPGGLVFRLASLEG